MSMIEQITERYRLIYRILVMPPKSTMTVDLVELKRAGIIGVLNGEYCINIYLNIRKDEYKITRFKKHLRIKRV